MIIDGEVVAIVGSREYPRLSDVIDFVNKLPHVVVVSGGARGVDRTAEQAAKARGLCVKVFPANWARFGRVAGFQRNLDIVKAADVVVAFWDGKSKGTQHTMKLAREWGKRLEVIRAS